jgi:hypothetical protein
MSNLYVLVVKGKKYMKGTEASCRRKIDELQLTNYLLPKLEVYNSTRFTDKKNKNRIMMPFNWDKLPKEAYPKVIEYIEQQKFNSLLKIHDDYDLSMNDFCCGEMVRRDLFNAFKWRHLKRLFNENAIDEE